uniref:Guanylate cyclase activator 2B n=1 Tax=Acanthochromis polyacanthus TaxID=80966 RepID=A0A3Q1GE59_9TELE
KGISNHLKMRVCSVVLVVVVCVCTGAMGVQVNVGDKSFPLEAVKQLQELMALNDNISPFAETSICTNPLLPQVFRPVCQARGAGTVFSKLAAVPLDICDICAFPACTGC